MNTTTTLDDNGAQIKINPGEQLSAIRQQRGYTIEYVANKLHLRSRIIELIEKNEYHLLPQPVFVKGYLRAYSKLLGISPEPYLTLFNEQHVAEKKPERALLWQQTRNESHKAEHIVRWFTILFALGVVIAVGMWWQKNRDNQPVYSTQNTFTDLSLDAPQKETAHEAPSIKSSEVLKIESLLHPKPDMSLLEKKGE